MTKRKFIKLKITDINYTFNFDFDVDALQVKYYDIIEEKIKNFSSMVKANQREFGLKFFNGASLPLELSDSSNIESYSISTYETRPCDFYLNYVFAKTTDDKIELSLSTFIELKYSVVLEK